jgi:SAM-dependent methyltransferase
MMRVSRPDSILARVARRLGVGSAPALERELRELRRAQAAMQRELAERLRQCQRDIGRLTRLASSGGRTGKAALSGRVLPTTLDDALEAPGWDGVGAGVLHPDPEGREWSVLDRCPVCGGADRTVVNPWNKLLLLARAPDASSIRYDYAVCHACGVLSAMRRPSGARFRFLLEHFGEVTAKRGGGHAIDNRVLNPYPLTDGDREQLRQLAAAGVFVSDHLGTKQYLPSLMRDRFETSGHVDVIGALVAPRGARVLEIRARTGSLLDGLRRQWGADVFAMPIWESQQFVLREVYDIPASDPIDFEAFRIPFEGPFDLIVAQHMFTHVLRPREFFEELRRHLTPGGHLYLHNEPDDEEFLAGRQSMIATLNPLHLQAFDQRSLQRGLAANGFDTVFLKRHGHTHICLARMGGAGMAPMPRGMRERRVGAYERAYDRAIPGLDEKVRGRVAGEWDAAVARAVAAGVAKFDERGRLRLVAR